LGGGISEDLDVLEIAEDLDGSLRTSKTRKIAKDIVGSLRTSEIREIAGDLDGTGAR
jgi:hypothetical protein